MEGWISPTTIVALIGALSALLAVIITWIRERRKPVIDKAIADATTINAHSNAHKNIADAYDALFDNQQEEISRLSGEFRKVSRWVYLWETWHTDLRNKWDEYKQLNAAPAAPDYQEK